jgi:hypothetical protein
MAAGLLGLALSAAAIWLVVRSVDLHEVMRQLSGAQAAPLAALVAVLALQTGVRAIRWTFLLPRRGVTRIPARRVLPPLLVGYLGNAVLPARLGEPARAILVSRREEIPGALAFGSVVLERVIDMAVLALIMLPAAWLVGAPRWVVEIAVVAAGIAGVVLVVLALDGLAALARWLLRVSGRLGGGLPSSAIAHVAARAREFASGAGAAGRRPDMAAAIGLTALAWLLDASIFWLAAISLGIELGPPESLLISGVAVLGTAIPSAPGYIGTYELAASAAAVALGVTPESALALAIVVHALTLLPLAVAGVVAFLAMQRELSRGDPEIVSAVATTGRSP